MLCVIYPIIELLDWQPLSVSPTSNAELEALYGFYCIMLCVVYLFAQLLHLQPLPASALTIAEHEALYGFFA